jgi:AAA15 family ATPase/GTPase
MIKRLTVKNFKRFSDSTFEFKTTGITIIAGANNSGKSSILHALATWEFCKLYLVNQKGSKSLLSRGMPEGTGMSIEDFSPVNIPSLKYLWTNIKPGTTYNLKLKCEWEIGGEIKFLEIALALQNERLLMKNSASNLNENDVEKIPTVAYLPPFAGISDKETWFSHADRRKLIGQGLAGAVLRNLLVDMERESIENKKKFQGATQRLKGGRLDQFMEQDPFSILNQTLAKTFQSNIIPQPFDSSFHNYVRVDVVKGNTENKRFKKFKGYNKRDIMVEGSGFLQWLSVYTIALNKNIDVLLLDEPDAHLHTHLQIQLLISLTEIALSQGKQVLMASHSTDVLKEINHRQIFEIKGSRGNYLSENIQKVGLLSGLGADYHPLINSLQKHKRFLFVENKSDAEILKIWCNSLELIWPKNLVIWPSVTKHKERLHIIKELLTQIDNLTGISLQDRDDDPFNTTSETLDDKNQQAFNSGDREVMYCLKWRRREIENYMLHPKAIAKSCNIEKERINQKLGDEFSLIIPEDEFINSDESDRLHPLYTVDAKRAFDILDTNFGVNKFKVAEAMSVEEIPLDVKTLIEKIIIICE